MAVVGCLGDVVFQVSSETVETIDKLEWSGSARYAVHERHLQNALTELTGVDPDKISFELVLSRELGVNVSKEWAKLWTYERSGKALPLVIGEHHYGKYRWNLVSHKITAEAYDVNGTVSMVTVAIELQEYLKS